MTEMTNVNPHSVEADRTPLRILFHINDFGKGGTETALLSWLKTLDRRQFAPSLSVAYPTDDLTFWRAQSIPEDVPVHVLASSKWMYALHQAARRRKLGTGEKLLHKLLTYGAIRPLLALRMRHVVKQHDLVCDFDFSLRHMAGGCNVPWFGVNHFSLAARLGSKSAQYIARRVRHYARYSAITVLIPAMLHEARELFSTTGVDMDIVELPNVIDVDALRSAARAAGGDEAFLAVLALLGERGKVGQLGELQACLLRAINGIVRRMGNRAAQFRLLRADIDFSSAGAHSVSCRSGDRMSLTIKKHRPPI